jgi:hypothetical protein
MCRSGSTLIEPDDPTLVRYVQGVVRLELVAIGAYDLLDVPRNNLVVRLGSGRSSREGIGVIHRPGRVTNPSREESAPRLCAFGVIGHRCP